MSQQILRQLVAMAPSAEAFSAAMTSGVLEPENPRVSRGGYLHRSPLASEPLGVLTRDAAEHIWKGGKVNSGPAEFAATLCTDGEFLLEMLRKDRRVGVAEAVCANDHLPIGALIDYLVGLPGGAGQAQSAGRSLVRRLNAEDPAVALSALRDGLSYSVYDSFSHRADLTADAARNYLQARFRTDGGRDAFFNEILSRSHGAQHWPVEDLLTLVAAPCGVTAARNLARHKSLVGDDVLAAGLIDAVTKPDPNTGRDVPRNELATELARHDTLSPASARRLYARLGEHDPTRTALAAWRALACNGAADPTWWADAHLGEAGSAFAAGRLLAACESLNDPAAYTASMQLAVGFEADVRTYVQTCLALFGDPGDDPFAAAEHSAVPAAPEVTEQLALL